VNYYVVDLCIEINLSDHNQMMVKESTMKFDIQDEFSENLTLFTEKRMPKLPPIINVGPHIEDVTTKTSVLADFCHAEKKNRFIPQNLKINISLLFVLVCKRHRNNRYLRCRRVSKMQINTLKRMDKQKVRQPSVWEKLI